MRVFVVAALLGCGGGHPIVDAESSSGKTPPVDAGGTTAAAPGEACKPTDGPALLVADTEKGGSLYWLAVDETHVYWLNSDSGALRRIPKCGGAVETVAHPALEVLKPPITMTSSAILWATATSIVRLPKAGGPEEVVASIAMVTDVVSDDGGNVFALGGLVGPGTLSFVPPGGAPASRANGLGPLALDEAFVYFRQPGQLVEQSRDGGLLTTLANDVAAAGGATALDSDHVYYTDWLNGLDGRVRVVPKAGGTPTTIASGEHVPLALAVDDARVYWADQDGPIRSAPKSGGAPSTLATSAQPETLTIDATRIYWTDFRDHAIYSIPKP